jgi:hypothetical protein
MGVSLSGASHYSYWVGGPICYCLVKMEKLPDSVLNLLESTSFVSIQRLATIALAYYYSISVNNN